MTTATESRALYLAWLRENFPEVYNKVLPDQKAFAPLAAPQLGGIFDSIGNAFNSALQNVTQSLPQLATAYAGYRTQRDLLRVNTQRASQGLPPLDQSGQLYGGYYTADEYRIAQTAGLSQSGWLMIGAAVLVLVFLLMSGRSRKRA